MPVDEVQGGVGINGGGAAGTVILDFEAPSGLDLPGNTQTTTPPTATVVTSRRIATVAYVRAAITAYGAAAGVDGGVF